MKNSSKKWLDLYFSDWRPNDDGIIDVLQMKTVASFIKSNIPEDVKFNIAYCDFFFDGSHITSLRGSPKICKSRFNCTNTYINSLEYAPEHVGGDFSCSFTPITSLEHCPKYVGGNFVCWSTNIKNAYDYRHALWCEIGGTFDCGIHAINDIINNCKNDPEKRPIALAALRKIKL